MKKTLFAIALVASTTLIFAQNPKSIKQEKKEAIKIEKPSIKKGQANCCVVGCDCIARGKVDTPRPRAISAKYDCMGTVTKVDEKNGTITVKNADNKEITVHVNPLTQFLPSTKNASTKETLTISSIKKDCWVAVKAFDTETNTLEAKSILLEQSTTKE